MTRVFLSHMLRQWLLVGLRAHVLVSEKVQGCGVELWEAECEVCWG